MMNINTQTKTQTHILAEFADLARTLGNEHRLLLLEHVAQGERPVERLAELAGLSIANASQHLQHLKRAGLVQTRREGKYVFYRLGDGPILGLLTALRQCVEYQHSQIQAFVADTLHQQQVLEAISRQELLARMVEGSITLLDVRSEEEFALGHLPGAINIPIQMLAERLAELPSRQEVVAYCRGPYCALSADALMILHAQGFQAQRLEEGFPDWKAAGLEVEVSSTT